ncbi:hypothetical protein HRR83_008416 [Exophiala dermatitidis]|uniref:ferric-chelate reductase (NADPH) n=1 Tax=Exophiala dermatitidis TaxID=5970 RepID=A0AAN6ELG4_EXODE|nr:hypothetical protein HRR75_007728 [Exophiala dermatitidis]KAJ4505901.1 hypothetical protein HRR73_008231 [Exophiala dermatitidis]KAJ4506513.1 hypothetical protein HRR74_008411 [Exophiala dermatitidis]KAJ4533698.1 hypothetical protein HRR77_008450 [Exophiala dermatitidis]KAJ4539372.1 hypothetical protein HRR78_007852 [Exophiala dermatitidis]
MASTLNMLSARHIQNMSDAKSLQHHWGYPDRAVPCTNDVGSCEYLDVVYHSHDLGMMYTGILWATIGGILFLWGLGKRLYQPSYQSFQLSGSQTRPTSSLIRLKNTIASYGRRYLLPDCLRPVFGRTTRLQVLILLTLTGYLTVWTFVGIVYKKWVTPVKNMPGVYNTRTSLGPWSDRIGVLAYGLTPLSVMLASRESILSVITGVPYQHFNFLHRWLGYIIFVQAGLHTIGWCVVELRLYQPQPTVGLEWIAQQYIIWGVIAMFFLTVMLVLSTPWAIRRTGYEFFRKTHYVFAMIYIGACWGHWAKLNCFLLPSLLIWFLDRGVRLARTGLLHYNYLQGARFGFRSTAATITHFPDADNGDVVRLDFDHPQEPWSVGQHFYLCFPEISIWQSHPFTPCSLPKPQAKSQAHSYILRAKQGATKSLAELATKKSSAATVTKELEERVAPTASVILAGPYGGSIVDHLLPDTNILCVAGGTGVTFVLPVLLQAINEKAIQDRKLELIWVIRRETDLSWIQQELDSLRGAISTHNLRIRIFVTRQISPEHGAGAKAHANTQVHVLEGQSTVSSFSLSSADKCTGSGEGLYTIQHLGVPGADANLRHPDLSALVREFVGSTVRGATSVFASGPGGMISDLRRTTASCNSGKKVWKGDERFDIKLVCDDRLEW